MFFITSLTIVGLMDVEFCRPPMDTLFIVDERVPDDSDETDADADDEDGRC